MKVFLFLMLAVLSFATFADDLIDLNTANAAELVTLPGIGPVKAEAIIEYRTENGRFVAIEEVKEVKGIGPKTFDGLKALIMVSAEEEMEADDAEEADDDMEKEEAETAKEE